MRRLLFALFLSLFPFSALAAEGDVVHTGACADGCLINEPWSADNENENTAATNGLAAKLRALWGTNDADATAGIDLDPLTTIGGKNFGTVTPECVNRFGGLSPEVGMGNANYHTYAWTVAALTGIARGGGSVNILVQECDAPEETGCTTVEAITLTAAGLEQLSGFDDAGILAGKFLRFSVTSVTNPVDSFSLTACGTRAVVP